MKILEYCDRLHQDVEQDDCLGCYYWETEEEGICPDRIETPASNKLLGCLLAVCVSFLCFILVTFGFVWLIDQLR